MIGTLIEVRAKAWIESYLSHRTIKGCVEGSLSSLSPIKGHILCPFTRYNTCNSLPKSTPHSSPFLRWSDVPRL